MMSPNDASLLFFFTLWRIACRPWHESQELRDWLLAKDLENLLGQNRSSSLLTTPTQKPQCVYGFDPWLLYPSAEFWKKCWRKRSIALSAAPFDFLCMSISSTPLVKHKRSLGSHYLKTGGVDWKILEASELKSPKTKKASKTWNISVLTFHVSKHIITWAQEHQLMPPPSCRSLELQRGVVCFLFFPNHSHKQTFSIFSPST